MNHVAKVLLLAGVACDAFVRVGEGFLEISTDRADRLRLKVVVKDIDLVIAVLHIAEAVKKVGSITSCCKRNSASKSNSSEEKHRGHDRIDSGESRAKVIIGSESVKKVG